MIRRRPRPLPRRVLVLASLSLAAISPAACATRPARTAPVPAPTTMLHLTGAFAPDSSRVGDGTPFFADAHLDGWLRIDNAEPASLPRVNPPAAGGAVALYNHYFGARTPVDTGVVEVIVRTVKTAALAGDTAVGVIVRVDTVAEGVDIPLDGVVLTERAHAGAALQPSLTPGDSVRWSLHFRGTPARVKELIGGFPMLLRDGASVLDRIDTTSKFSITRHPRTAVGVRADGTVLLVVVDGRSEASGGMSLARLTAFMKGLGARDALNLDGGGSTVLDVGDQVASHPSDKTGERAVANALLVLGPPAHRCEGGAPHLL